MFRPKLSLPVLALISACAQAAPPPRADYGPEDSIPFASTDGILEWKVAGPDSVYLLSMSNQWYLAHTMAPCPRLRSAVSLGFVTSPGDKLDRYSAILAEGRRCQLTSVVRSGPPPVDAPRPRSSR